MYMCICVYVYVCMCVCVYVCMCVCVYVCMCVCVYVCMCVCVYVCMYVCMDGWMDGYMYGYRWIYDCMQPWQVLGSPPQHVVVGCMLHLPPLLWTKQKRNNNLPFHQRDKPKQARRKHNFCPTRLQRNKCSKSWWLITIYSNHHGYKLDG